jgi:hypothetical protein
MTNNGSHVVSNKKVQVEALLLNGSNSYPCSRTYRRKLIAWSFDFDDGKFLGIVVPDGQIWEAAASMTIVFGEAREDFEQGVERTALQESLKQINNIKLF